MTYMISLTGHGATSDDVVEAFENAVRALRQVNAEGIKEVSPGTSDQTYLSGSLSGSGSDGVSVSKSVNDVQDLDEADAADEGPVEADDDPASGEALVDGEQTDPDSEEKP